MDSAAVLVQQSESASHSSGNSDSKIMESSSTNEEGISMVESMDPKTAEKVRQYQSQIKVLLHNYQVQGAEDRQLPDLVAEGNYITVIIVILL